MIDLLPGFSLFAVAIAVLLSAFVSLIQTMALRQRVAMKVTGVRELAELSGITDPRDLQDVFGPPGMDRVWRHITLPQIEAHKRLAGYLMSDNRVDWASMAAAFAAMMFGHPVLQLALVIAALAQLGGWLTASQLPK